VSHLTTRLFPSGRPSKAAARRECDALEEEARAAGLSWHVAAKSQQGLPCVTLYSNHADEHRRLAAWAERRIPGALVTKSNAAAARVLGRSS
jgi:uncharacterized membrane protein